jgi:uncharacterized protein (UPF0548 family)
MRILSKRKSREAPFGCEEWSQLATNSTRDEVARGFLHDVYEARFEGDFASAVDALFAYRIFAPGRMHAHVCTPDRLIALGATIIQRVAFGPVSIETAVRVIEVERRSERASFAYATLRGHPERGVASFAVSRADAGGVFEAQAWSRAGNHRSRMDLDVPRVDEVQVAADARLAVDGDAARQLHPEGKRAIHFPA